MLPRELELFLGICGGVLGLLGSLFYILFTVNMEPTWPFDYLLPGLNRVIASVIALWITNKIQYEPKKSGVTFIICGVWLFLLANVTRPGSILLIIAGLLCLVRK